MPKKRIRYRVGAVVTIPLPDGRFGYGRLYQNLTIGLFRLVSKELRRVEDVIKHPIGPILLFHDEAVEDGRWPVIGSFPFASNEESWGPPSRGMGDTIWVKGQMVVPTSSQERKKMAAMKGLESHQLRDPDEIIRRVYLANGLRLPKSLRPRTKQAPAEPNEWTTFAPLFRNDTAAMVKERYEEAREDGATKIQASKTVLAEFEGELEDSDDRPRVLIPLAVLQLLAMKRVQAKLQEQVLELLCDKTVLRDYPAGAFKEDVQNALRKLRTRLSGGVA